LKLKSSLEEETQRLFDTKRELEQTKTRLSEEMEQHEMYVRTKNQN